MTTFLELVSICAGKMKRIGTRIRTERKKSGLTLKQLARKVGISPITLHRIETGKSSPSVVLLSEIAQNLNRSISLFIQELENAPYVLIKQKDQRSISSSGLKVKVIGPQKMITDNISVTYGELKKGKTIDLHTNPGIEWAYVLEGRCEEKLGKRSVIMEAGDSMAYDARTEHSVTAIEKLKFIAIYVRDKE